MLIATDELPCMQVLTTAGGPLFSGGPLLPAYQSSSLSERRECDDLAVQGVLEAQSAAAAPGRAAAAAPDDGPERRGPAHQVPPLRSRDVDARVRAAPS